VSPGAILTDWRDEVGALLAVLLPGQAYGDAIVETIWGDHVPTGKLPLTFPAVENEVNFTLQQWPGVHRAKNTTPCLSWHDTGGCFAEYSERLHVGYRWYSAHTDVVPAFPFGHGCVTFVSSALWSALSQTRILVTSSKLRPAFYQDS
jgi:beta-glucosidase